MKKIFSLALAIVLIFSLAACGNTQSAIPPSNYTSESLQEIADQISNYVSENNSVSNVFIQEIDSALDVTLWIDFNVDIPPADLFAAAVFDTMTVCSELDNVGSVHVYLEDQDDNSIYLFNTGLGELGSITDCTSEEPALKVYDSFDDLANDFPILSYYMDIRVAAEEGTYADVKDSDLTSAASQSLQVIKKEFCIIDFSISGPNSAGGVDVDVSFWDTERAVKYAYFWVTPYNGVGDPVTCEITGKSQNLLTFTGPSHTYGPSSTTFDTVWYNETIRNAILNKVKIEFMDGTVFETEETRAISIGATRKNENGSIEILVPCLRAAVNDLLKEKGISKEDFIARYAEIEPSFANYAENILDEGTIFNEIGEALVVAQFSEILEMTPMDFLYTLQEYVYK